MNQDYSLVYYHRETGKKVFVKWVTRLDFIILDPETGVKLPLSRYALDKAYKADKSNNKIKNKSRINFENRKEC